MKLITAAISSKAFIAMTGIAAVLFFSLSSIAQADPRIYVAQGISFGRVIPRANSVTVIIDGLGSKKPVCAPESSGSVSGGHAAALYFYDFGDVTINLSLPSRVDLYDENGQQCAFIQRMHMFSNMQAFIEGFRKKAYIGGELIADVKGYGKTLTGTVRVDITTY